ncbi:MAG: SDR family NAD(P)-dependent oxidoreductase [Chloroflexota bacterium]|jgi:glucose 1-dehydrogenase
MRLLDKVVVVTGSTRGIGRAVAEACAQEGAQVVLCSRSQNSVQKAVEQLTAKGLRVSGIPVDVTVQADLEKLLQHTLDRWGKVDVWINNAGLSGSYLPLEEVSPEEIRALVDTNLTATIQACRLLIPYFAQHGGVLINMSGRGGRGEAVPFLPVYSATKIAIISLTKSLAKENSGRPISIHAVLPGMVATDFYVNVKSNPRTEPIVEGIPYVLKAIGIPIEDVARLFVEIAAQQPGRETGKVYSLFKGWRMIRGIALLTWYRATGKLRGA